MIYRLNTIGVVLISFAFGRPWRLQDAGNCVGILGVVLLYRRGVGAVAPVFSYWPSVRRLFVRYTAYPQSMPSNKGLQRKLC